MDNVREYKFSVIMPIYNAASFLDEAIGTVISQTIGFEDSIQLILVNDGSSDNSGQICRKYLSEYPENVIYVEQENRGVSSARNAGIPYIAGKYVNFFDSDDMWDPEAFVKVWDFFENHGEEIDVACCRAFFFESKEGEHYLNNKFINGDWVVDVNEHPNYCLLNVTTAFIRAAAIGEERFDERLSVGEDSKFIIKAVLKKQKYGAVGSARYNIRRRNDHSSITQNRKLGRYTDTVEHYYKYMLDYSEEKYGKAIPYVQYSVYNGLKYRVMSEKEDFIDDELWNGYVNKVVAIIGRLDDEMITYNLSDGIFLKMFMLSRKHGRDIWDELYIKDGFLWFDSVKLKKITRFIVKNLEESVNRRHMTVEGSVMFPLGDNIRLMIEVEGRYEDLEITDDDSLDWKAFDGTVVKRGKKFRKTIPCKRRQAEYSLVLACNGKYTKIPKKKQNK